MALTFPKAAAMAGLRGAANFVGRQHGAVLGAAAGGLYGAFSNDTSILGGAAMGAGIGLGARYGRAGFNVGARMSSRMADWNKLLPAPGYRWGVAGLSAVAMGRAAKRDFNSLMNMGAQSNRLIGTHIAKGVNRIQGMFPGMFPKK